MTAMNHSDPSSSATPRATPSQDAIARRAYQIWQDAGYPGGSHEDHWRQAERELTLGERGVPMDASPATGGPSRPGSGPPPARSDAAPAPVSTTPNSASGSSSISGQGAAGSGRGSGSGRR